MATDDEIHEDTDHNFQCEATGGIPQAVSMMWYQNNQLVTNCENLALGTPCDIHITRADHQTTVRCQEFQIEYQEGGSAQETLNVLCKCKASKNTCMYLSALF